LLAQARHAYNEGKIGEEDWKTLPTTPEAMWNLMMVEGLEPGIADVLLDGIKRKKTIWQDKKANH
jgi:hypothetical protein